MALRIVPTASPVSPVRYVIEGSASRGPISPEAIRTRNCECRTLGRRLAAALDEEPVHLTPAALP